VVDVLKGLGLDRYDLTARLRPALFVVLPVLLLAMFWLPGLWTFIGGTVSLLTTCGLTFLLAQIARYMGRRAEKKLGDRVGAPNSARILSHADARIDAESKQRFHALLRARGRNVPSPSEEAADPTEALQRFAGCVTWLISHTRDEKRFDLLFNENIAYGFRRNLYGLKWVAVGVLIFSLAGNVAATILNWSGFGETLWQAAALGAGYLAALAIWAWVVTPSFVEDASDAYAMRLMAACDTMPTA